MMRLKLYKINKNRLLLLPLAILLCFSCSLKQEIKQFFDIPLNSSVYTPKPTDSRVCTTANFVSVTDHLSKTKPQGESKFIVNSSDCEILSLVRITKSGNYEGNKLRGESGVPIFILQRKLII